MLPRERTAMLARCPMPEAVAPPAEDSLFNSYSLSACVVTMLELPELPPVLLENLGHNWYKALDHWAHQHRLQAFTFDSTTEVRGLHLRFACDDSKMVTAFDGHPCPSLHAILFFGDEEVHNPAEVDLDDYELFNMKIVLLPYDPKSNNMMLAN